jgi:Sel1 repeat
MRNGLKTAIMHPAFLGLGMLVMTSVVTQNTRAGSPGDLVASAEKLEKGSNGAPDFAAAAALYQKAADQGDTEAMNRLALFYLSGTGVTRDQSKAFELFRKAADGKHPKANYNLGLCYRDGIGVEKNPEYALNSFLSGADLGSPEAMTALAGCLSSGSGTQADPTASRQWLEKAAKSGYPPAMCRLAGLLLQGGSDVSADPAAARSWYAKASALGDKEAAERLKALAKATADEAAAKAGIKTKPGFSHPALSEPPRGGPQNGYNANAYMSETYVPQRSGNGGAIVTSHSPDAPPPTGEMTTQQQNKAAELLAFLKSYLLSMVSNKPEMVAANFADSVDYCYGNGQGASTPAEIAEDASKLIQRYPVRSYSNFNVRKIIPMAEDQFEIDYVFDYSYQGRKAASGSSEVDLGVKHFPEGWKIVSYHENVQRN